MNANSAAEQMAGNNEGANVANAVELQPQRHHQNAQIPPPFYNGQMAISYGGQRASLEHHQQRRRSGDDDHVRPLLIRTPGHWGSTSTGRDKRDFEHSFCDCKNMDLCRCGEDFKGSTDSKTNNDK